MRPRSISVVPIRPNRSVRTGRVHETTWCSEVSTGAPARAVRFRFWFRFGDDLGLGLDDEFLRLGLDDLGLGFDDELLRLRLGRDDELLGLRLGLGLGFDDNLGFHDRLGLGLDDSLGFDDGFALGDRRGLRDPTANWNPLLRRGSFGHVGDLGDLGDLGGR